MRGQAIALAVTGVAVLLLAVRPSAQKLDDDRAIGRRVLREIKKELEVRYYDPTFGGRDLDELFADAEKRIAQARSQAEISGQLAQAVMSLGDSHTYFIPSPLPYEVDYGFHMQMIGERCFVTAVKGGSLAEQDGLRAGMALLSIEGVPATRNELWKIRYALNVVRPRKELRLVVQAPGQSEQVKIVRASIGEARRYQSFEDWAEVLEDKLRARAMGASKAYVVDDTVLIAKLSTFSTPEKKIDELLKAAAGKRGLVLDLRENGGGAVDSLVRLTSYLFESRQTIGQLMRRTKAQPLTSEPRKAGQLFNGKMVVLVDSLSASASEVLARHLQLQKRATIVGDRTMGAVMVSMGHTYTEGTVGRFLLYGLSITDAKLLMGDGESLEGKGVMPDEILLPTAEDLAAGRDPVLAHAAELVGATLTPERAGGLFVREWQ